MGFKIMSVDLSIVVPCYNEEDALPVFYKKEGCDDNHKR